MKKIKETVFFAYALGFLLSCSSDEIENYSNNSDNSETIKIAYIDANGNITNCGEAKDQVLYFASEAKYNEFVQKVKHLSNDEKMEFFDGLGFTNLKKIELIADHELDSIAENCSNEAEFRSKYNDYVNKYATSLEINKYDSLDLSLYVPASSDEDVDPYIVGANKTFVVNGQARKINFKNEMNSIAQKVFGSQSSTAQVVYTEMEKDRRKKVNSSMIKATGTNGVTKWVTSSIKIITNFHIDPFDNPTIDFNPPGYLGAVGYLYFGAQKSMWYGSKRTSRPMFFLLESLNGCGFQSGYASYSDKGSFIVPLKYKTANKNYPSGPYYGLTCESHNKKGEFCDIGTESFPVGWVNLDRFGRYNVTGSYYAWIMVNGERPTQDNMVDLENYPCVKVNINQEGTIRLEDWTAFR